VGAEARGQGVIIESQFLPSSAGGESAIFGLFFTLYSAIWG
jgi:hypothetical protein